jgi:Rrf2 family transcriptional regulator, nitric oxide-sensitive transcriptional repressor
MVEANSGALGRSNKVLIPMRRTNFTDFALRVLMFAAPQDNRLITIEETVQVYGISRAHLMKVVNQLTRTGYLKAERGRSGGLRLLCGRGNMAW